MNNNKQTAVEWLIEEIKNFDSGRSQYYSKVAIYNHAYRMEKEDHKKTYYQGLNSNFQDFEQYYNETYGKNINDNTNL